VAAESSACGRGNADLDYLSRAVLLLANISGV